MIGCSCSLLHYSLPNSMLLGQRSRCTQLLIQYVTKCLKKEEEMFYLTTHSTHFMYGYMALDIWQRTIQIARKKIHCRHMGYSFRLTARVLLYAPFHRQYSTYHCLCYIIRGALAGTRDLNGSTPWRIDPTTHRTMSERSYHGATSRSQNFECQWWHMWEDFLS